MHLPNENLYYPVFLHVNAAERVYNNLISCFADTRDY